MLGTTRRAAGPGPYYLISMVLRYLVLDIKGLWRGLRRAHPFARETLF